VKPTILIGMVLCGCLTTGLCASTFSDYLLEHNLNSLYRLELHRRCLEEGDIQSCLELAQQLSRQGSGARIEALADSLDLVQGESQAGRLLVRAEVLLGEGRFDDAVAFAERAMQDLPPKDLLIEALLIRAEAAYHAGRSDLMRADVEVVGEHLDPQASPRFAFLLGLVKADMGDLDEAQALIEVAFEGGVVEAGPELLRICLKRDDLDAFASYLERLGRSGNSCSQAICEIACEVEDVMPSAWHKLMAYLASDSTFDAGAYPEVVEGIIRQAEGDEKVASYCDILLRNSSRSAIDGLRYARALSLGSVDSLVVVARQARRWDIRLRAAMAIMARNAQPGLALQIALSNLREVVSLHGDEISEGDLLAVAKLLGTLSSDIGQSDIILEICDRLAKASEPDVVLELGNLVKTIDPDRASRLYASLVSQSVPSLETLEAEKALWELRARREATSDIAGEVERIAAKGLDAFDLARVLVERLGAYERAIPHYRRALAGASGTEREDAIRADLIECLLRSQDGREARLEMQDLLRQLVTSQRVGTTRIIELTKAATVFARHDYDLATDVLKTLSRRNELSPGETYELLRLGFYLFLLGQGQTSDLCGDLVDHLLSRYPSSAETGLAVLLDARMRFLRGDYLGSLKRYRLCLKRWQGLAADCQMGMGDCYLYSGGLQKAIVHFKASPDARALAKIGKCYDILEQPDSARVYYSEALRRFTVDPWVNGIAGLGLGLLEIRKGSRPDLAFLESPIAPGSDLARERRLIRRMLKCYYLGTQGYGFARRLLGVEFATDPRSACLARLLAADLACSEDVESALSLLPHPGQCYEIFAYYDLLSKRALYACMTDSSGICQQGIDDFMKRFPLAGSTINALRDEMVLQTFRLGEGRRALRLVDSLSAEGYRPGRQVIYREGIEFMIQRRYREALRTFASLLDTLPQSDLYYDASFKLGVAYYQIGAYDSSAAYFELASSTPRTDLAREALFNGGLAWFEIGNYSRAFECFWTYATRFPLDDRFERALLRAGFALDEMGRCAGALAIYEKILNFTTTSTTAAETQYWIGQAYSRMGNHARAALEYLRATYLYPQVAAWAGTASFEAGLECEKAGLLEEATIIYNQTAARFGKETDWGKAALERLRVIRSQVD